MTDQPDVAPKAGRNEPEIATGFDQVRVLRDLTQIIRMVLGRNDLDIGQQTTARDVPGWDSFRMVEIVVASEDHFGIELDARDVDRFNCVGDMVEAIVDKLRIPDRGVP